MIQGRTLWKKTTSTIIRLKIPVSRFHEGSDATSEQMILYRDGL